MVRPDEGPRLVVGLEIPKLIEDVLVIERWSSGRIIPAFRANAREPGDQRNRGSAKATVLTDADLAASNGR
jgi:uncharacterized Ntn-hydrolase superfamily protein